MYAFKISSSLFEFKSKKLRVKFTKKMLKIFEMHIESEFKYVLTGDESWFNFHYEPTTQWVLSSEYLEEKLDPSKFEEKMMVTVFMNGDGFQLIKFKEPDETINSSYFINNVVRILNENCANIHPPEDLHWMIHYDNARPHTSKIVNAFLEETCLERMPHPPYSPDLAPCDFGLFGTVKNKMIGYQADSREDLQNEITQILQKFTKDDINSIFMSWLRRLNLCIKLKGDYVE